MHVKGRNEGVEMDFRGIRLAGATTVGEVRVWKLQETENLQMTESEMKAGFIHPTHVHPNNESVGFVISGRVEMVIDDVTYNLKSGDSWHHPKGVYHQTKALEDSNLLEIHFPLRPAFMGNGPALDQPEED